MCSTGTESGPKDFEKATEMLPLAAYGLTTVEEYRKAEGDKHHQEWLLKAGLTNEEIKLYTKMHSGLLDHHSKVDPSILKSKVEDIKRKINSYQQINCSQQNNESNITEPVNSSQSLQNRHLTFYPEGHPMNNIKELEENLFGHINNDQLPITKRRKILRRLERKKERIMSQHFQASNQCVTSTVNKPGSLWDQRQMPTKIIDSGTPSPCVEAKKEQEMRKTHMIGPKKPTMYTIKHNKIVRLEPLSTQDEFKAVDIKIPVNTAEAQLLEGTRMSLEDIKKIDRFKDYHPGTPSKVLYLKNIAPPVTQDRLSAIFKNFTTDNGGPIDVRLMTGRMRGQAFVAFQSETVAMHALQEVNGTIMCGRPIIIQYGKNSNRIQSDKYR